MTIAELYTDKRLNDMIRKISGNEYDDVRSELFYIIIEADKVEKIPTYEQQIYHCSRILKSTIHSNTSNYFMMMKNHGQRRSSTTVPLTTYNIMDEYEDDKHDDIIDRINEILNQLPWYESSIFRLYYLPYPDVNC